MRLCKSFLFLGLIVLSAVSYGQRRSGSSTELGIRLASGWGNFSIDAAVPLSSIPRLHCDISFGDNWIGFDGLFDFMYSIPDVDGFYVYAGPGFGVGLSFYDYYDTYYHENRSDTDLYASILGEIGAEYKIPQVPFTVGFDIRPGINVAPRFRTHVSAGLNLRYRF